MLKGSKRSLLYGSIGSVIMIFTIGLMPYYGEYSAPRPLLMWVRAWPLSLVGLPIVVGAIAATGVRSWREKPLAGALCGVPAAVTYWYLMDVAIGGDYIIAPAMAAWIMGFGAIGGLISLGIQFFRQTIQD